MKINNNLKEIIKTASNNIEIIQILALQDIFKSNRQRHKYLDTMFIGRYKPDFSTIQKAFPKKKDFEEFILSYKRKLPKKVFNEMPWDKYRELKIACYRYLPRKQKKCMLTYLALLKQKKGSLWKILTISVMSGSMILHLTHSIFINFLKANLLFTRIIFLKKLHINSFKELKVMTYGKMQITAFSIIKESKIYGACHGKKKKKCKKAFCSKILI